MAAIDQKRKQLEKLSLESGQLDTKIRSLREEIDQWEEAKEKARGDIFFSYLCAELVDVLSPEHVKNKRLEECNDKNYINYTTCSRCALLELMNLGYWNSEYEIEFKLRNKGS